MAKLDESLQNLEAEINNLQAIESGNVDFNSVRNSSKEFLKELERISFSETMSLYSHIPHDGNDFVITGLKNLSSREAIGLVLAVDEFHPEWASLIRIELENLCYLKRYQGLWRTTHRLLKLYRLDQKIFILFEMGFSQRTLFGNILKLAKVRIKKIGIYKTMKTKVVYPQRKRGYNDHGSRKEDSKWLPKDIHLGANPVREDYRTRYKNKKKSFFNFLWK
jgi:hypothetical protein